MGIIVSFMVLVISLFEFIELLRRSMSKTHIQLIDLFLLTALKVPFHLQVFFPFICMVAAMVSLWKLNQFSEIIAARSVGFSTFQIIKNLSICVFILGVFNLSVINPLSSVMLKRVESLDNMLFKNTAKQNQFFLNESGLWLREELKEEKLDRTIFIKKYNILLNQFKGIHIFEMNKAGVLVNHYIADSASLDDGQWTLNDVHLWNAEFQEKSMEKTSFLTALSMRAIEENNAKPETISFWELPFFIKSLYQSGLSTIKYELYWYSLLGKITQAMALIFLAASFCMHPTRYKKTSVLVLMGVVIGFLLHFFTDVIYAFGLSQKIPLLLAVFAPTLITAFLSFGLLLRIEQG